MRVSLPSPTAASLGKFGDVPVSLYTGVPDISIPLFVAKGRTLELPIVLKYHAGGIRVEEIGGWAGIGWTLEAGGAITRTVRGLSDERGAGYWNTGHVFYSGTNWSDPPESLLDDIRNRLVDGEPDQFFFNFAGRSGQFVMGPTSASPSVKEIRPIPYQKIRIEADDPGGPFVITTEDGTRYTFNAGESTADWHLASSEEDPPDHGIAYPTSWQLTEIRSPGGDVITLHYTQYTARHRLGKYWEVFSSVLGTCSLADYWIQTEIEVEAQRLDSIKTAAHTVKFVIADTLRQDAVSPTGTRQEPRLAKIVVTTPGGAVLRQFRLDHDYSTGRLTLKNVFEENGASLPPYSFTYNGPGLPGYASFAQDHWGYYNGKSNSNPVPPTADRNPDSTFMRAASLARITYPTGGYNEFFYEGNDYGGIGLSDNEPLGQGPPQSKSLYWEWPMSTVTKNFNIGGSSPVQVTIQIWFSDPSCEPGADDGCPITQIDGVGVFETMGTHYRTLSPATYTMRIEDNAPEGWAIIEVTWPGTVAPVKKKPGGGLRVREIRTVDGMGNTTLRKYQYTRQSDPARSSGMVQSEPDYEHTYDSPQCDYTSRSSASKMPLGAGTPGQISYKEVTVLHGANGEFGKTRHLFRSVASAADDPGLMHSVWPHSRWTSREWKRGQEFETTEMNAAGQIQRRVKFKYAFRDQGTPDPQTTRHFKGLSIHVVSAGKYGSTYLYNPFEVSSAWYHQESDTTVVYDTTGTSSFVAGRAFVYDNPSHVQPTEITETNSDGIQRITKMKYPADFASGSGNAEAVALSAMQGSAHIHSPVIERWVTQRVGATDSVVQAEVTSFKTFAAGQYLPYQRFVLNSAAPLTNFVPSSVTAGSFAKDSRYLLQETANSYDAFGRITQLADARGKLTDYGFGGNPNSAFLTQVKRLKDASGLVDLVTDLAYDSLGFLASITDEGGSFRRFSYDLFGRLRQIKNHSDSVVKAFGYTYSRTSPSWTFNASSPNAVIDSTFLRHSPTPKSVVSTQFLDGLGRSIQTVVQDGSSFVVSASQYDVMGRPWRSWKPYTRATAGYDASFVTNATSFYNTYHATSNAKPYVETQYRADALDRVSKLIPEYIGTSPTVFRAHSYGIDAGAKHAIAEVADPLGKKTRSFADVFGNEVKTILGAGAPEATTTLAAFDVRGQRIKTTDPRGLVTTYALDTRALPIWKTSPDAGTVLFKHDKNGNLRYTQDANDVAFGHVNFTNYDFANRPLVSGEGPWSFGSLDPDADPLPLLETNTNAWHVVRAYDAKPSTGAFPWSLFSAEITPLTLANVSGRLAAIASRSNGAWQATLFSYDAEGRVATRHTFTQANGGGSVLAPLNTQVTYVRDLRDAITERWLTVGANTFNHWYEFDNRGLLWRVFASTGASKPPTADVTFTYRPSGQPQDRQFQGGPLVPMRYTIREELEKIGDPVVTTYPFSARYAYHKNGNLSESEFYSAGSPAAQKRYRYVFDSASYDALNRLKKADFSGWSGSSWTSTLAHDLANIGYDSSGNIKSLQRYRETGTLVDNVAYSYSGISNRLNSVSDAAGATSESWDAETGSFTYDANGNVITAPAPYALTAITYDHQNLPLSLTSNGVSSGYRYEDTGQRIMKQVTGGNMEVYVRDDANTLCVVSVNGSGVPVSWDFNILAGDAVVGLHRSGGNRRYYHTDLLGSTRAVVEGATVVESYDFEPWGVLMPGRTLGGDTKEGFTGKERDVESGLSYFGARLYMPAFARWTSVDPMADEFPASSPYNYTLNNPVASIDPMGRAPIVLTGADAQDFFRDLKADLASKGRLEEPDAEHKDGRTATEQRCPPCRGAEWDLKNIERETQYYESLTTRDRLMIGGLTLLAAGGGFAIMGASTHLMAAAAPIAGTMPAWPKAIEGQRKLIESVVKGKESLDKLTPRVRELAARHYEQIARNVRGNLAEQARAFNLERARYLREGGPTPPGTLPKFIERTNQPPR
jgi:RHS repeat-associated protein